MLSIGLIAGLCGGAMALQTVLNWLVFVPRDKRRTAETLQRCAAETKFVVSRGHRLFVRTVSPTGTATKRCMVFIPNGMAATVAMIGQLQDKLAEVGMASVSYDR